MRHIYFEKKEIAIPSGAHINKHNGRVYIYLDNTVRRKSHTMVIGRATGETTMYPNDNFKNRYPALWAAAYGEQPQVEKTVDVGTYALMLGAGYDTGIYNCLVDTVQPLYANGIMDLATSWIVGSTNAVTNFSAVMEDKVLFSDKQHDEGWNSELFSKVLSKDVCTQLRNAWMAACKKKGATKGMKVWIVLDGTNVDCDSENVELAKKGHSKSGDDSDVVALMYAVCADTGMPLTYLVYDGNIVDGKAFMIMYEYLVSQELVPQGFILDRGFCTSDVISKIRAINKDFVVMLKSDTAGNRFMVEKHGEEIRWNFDHLVSLKGTFGTTDSGKMFKDSEEDVYLNLFYEAKSGCDRSLALMEKVAAEIRRLERIRDSGKGVLEVAASLAKYIDIATDGDRIDIRPVPDALSAAVSEKGFYTIASTLDLSVKEIDRIYDLRDSPEKVFSAMKTQLGAKTLRAHSTEGAIGRSLVCFVALVLRWAISAKCKELDLVTNGMIGEVSKLKLFVRSDGYCTAIHNETTRQKMLLESFDIQDADFDAIAQNVNARAEAVHSLVNKKPDHNPVPVRKKPGIKKGTKLRRKKKEPVYVLDGKVVTKEEFEANTTGAKGKIPEINEDRKNPGNGENSRQNGTDSTDKKSKRGRPKGSKNKKTIEREKAAEAAKVKRGPGRPKGSRNKPKPGQPVWNPRKPGRPKGSKDKEKRTRRWGKAPKVK